MVKTLETIAESHRFQTFITGVIVFAGLLVGAETYPAVVERYGGILHVLDKVVLWIFVTEIAIKMGAQGARPWRYFRDPWNVFDFTIVAAAFLPFAAQYATVLRLLRLLRVLRLVRAVPKLQLLVGALLKSIPSMGYVSILLLLLFYVYAVAAVFLFGANDPLHFGDLQISFVSLFRVVTLEGWTELLYIQMYGCDQMGYDGMEHLCTQPSASPVGAVIFFVSFVLLGTMIILNLFIGVILSGMDEARREAEDESDAIKARIRGTAGPSLADELKVIAQRLGEIQSHVEKLQRRSGRDGGDPAPAPTPEDREAVAAE